MTETSARKALSSPLQRVPVRGSGLGMGRSRNVVQGVHQSGVTIPFALNELPGHLLGECARAFVRKIAGPRKQRIDAIVFAMKEGRQVRPAICELVRVPRHAIYLQ